MFRREMKKVVDIMSSFSPLSRIRRQAANDVGRFHVAEGHVNPAEIIVQLFERNPFVIAHVRRLGIAQGEQHVMLMQHAVMLDVMQQRRRRVIDIAGEEDRRAVHPRQRPLGELLHQRFDGEVVTLHLLGKQVITPHPDTGIDIISSSDNSTGTKPPSMNLVRLAPRNTRSERQQRQNHQQRQRPWPVPAIARYQQNQRRGNHHRPRHGDTVGGEPR